MNRFVLSVTAAAAIAPSKERARLPIDFLPGGYEPTARVAQEAVRSLATSSGVRAVEGQLLHRGGGRFVRLG